MGAAAMNQQSDSNSVNLREGTDFPYLALNVIDGNSYPRNPGFQVMHWHEDLQFICVLSDLEQQKTPLYVYEVLTTLCMLWLELCRVVTLPQTEPPQNVTEERMTLFLRCIEQHYAEPISLAALAESAHVSKSECLRCFKASLQTAPYQYLMEYRLSKAAELLCNTDLPISEVAARVGFSQASHFGKCFREKTGMPPRAYRKSKKSACRK